MLRCYYTLMLYYTTISKTGWSYSVLGLVTVMLNGSAVYHVGRAKS
jgi:hypothetical protein